MQTNISQTTFFLSALFHSAIWLIKKYLIKDMYKLTILDKAAVLIDVKTTSIGRYCWSRC